VLKLYERVVEELKVKSEKCALSGNKFLSFFLKSTPRVQRACTLAVVVALPGNCKLQVPIFLVLQTSGLRRLAVKIGYCVEARVPQHNDLNGWERSGN